MLTGPTCFASCILQVFSSNLVEPGHSQVSSFADNSKRDVAGGHVHTPPQSETAEWLGCSRPLPLSEAVNRSNLTEGDFLRLCPNAPPPPMPQAMKISVGGSATSKHWDCASMAVQCGSKTNLELPINPSTIRKSRADEAASQLHHQQLESILDADVVPQPSDTCFMENKSLQKKNPVRSKPSCTIFLPDDDPRNLEGSCELEVEPVGSGDLQVHMAPKSDAPDQQGHGLWSMDVVHNNLNKQGSTDFQIMGGPSQGSMPPPLPLGRIHQKKMGTSIQSCQASAGARRTRKTPHQSKHHKGRIPHQSQTGPQVMPHGRVKGVEFTSEGCGLGAPDEVAGRETPWDVLDLFQGVLGSESAQHAAPEAANRGGWRGEFDREESQLSEGAAPARKRRLVCPVLLTKR